MCMYDQRLGNEQIPSFPHSYSDTQVYLFSAFCLLVGEILYFLPYSEPPKVTSTSPESSSSPTKNQLQGSRQLKKRAEFNF